jgi:hypothetical protein
MMTTITYVHRIVIPAAYALLPPIMHAPPATAMLLAIGLQESRFEHRRQLGPGPARGWWQFERMGIAGVLSHPASQPWIMPVVNTLGYPGTANPCHVAVEHNDIMACCFARLLLWTLPVRLPTRDEAGNAWAQYLAGWRPGKPHRATWDDFYRTAWNIVTEELE